MKKTTPVKLKKMKLNKEDLDFILLETWSQIESISFMIREIQDKPEHRKKKHDLTKRLRKCIDIEYKINRMISEYGSNLDS
jgi:hypothetical protein